MLSLKLMHMDLAFEYILSILTKKKWTITEDVWRSLQSIKCASIKHWLAHFQQPLFPVQHGSLLKLAHNHPQFCTTSLPEPSPTNQSVFQLPLLKMSQESTMVFHCQHTKERLSFQWMSLSLSERTYLVSKTHLKSSITFLSCPHLEVKKTTSIVFSFYLWLLKNMLQSRPFTGTWNVLLLLPSCGGVPLPRHPGTLSCASFDGRGRSTACPRLYPQA